MARFDLRGAVQGAAYTNWYIQQAKYKQRKDKEEQMKQQRFEAMQQEGMAIQRYNAETGRIGNEQEAERSRQKVLAAEAKLTWDQDAYDARVKREELESNRSFLEQKQAYKDADEDRDRGYELDLGTLEYKKQREKNLNVNRRALTAIKAEASQKYPDMPSKVEGFFGLGSDMYKDLRQELLEHRAQWAGDIDYDDVDAIKPILWNELKTQLAGKVAQFNAIQEAREATINPENMMGVPTLPRADVNQIIQVLQEQLNNPNSVFSEQIRQQDANKEISESGFNRKEIQAERKKMQVDETIETRTAKGELTELEVIVIKLDNYQMYLMYQNILEGIRQKQYTTGTESEVKRLEQRGTPQGSIR